MTYEIVVTDPFRRQARRLAARYPSLRDDLRRLASELREQSSVESGLYKIRLEVRSRGKGKGRGARILAYAILPERTIYLLTIYTRKRIDALSDRDLRGLSADLFDRR